MMMGRCSNGCKDRTEVIETDIRQHLHYTGVLIMELLTLVVFALFAGFIVWLVVPLALGIIIATIGLVIWSIKFLIELTFGSDDNG